MDAETHGDSTHRRWSRRATASAGIVLVTVALSVLVVAQFSRERQPVPEAPVGTEQPGRMEAEPAPSPESEPPDIDPRAGEAERVGLHVSDVELDLWRSRARQGPYRSPGDVREHSPGDWMRIRDNAQAFMDDPDGFRWRPQFQGCIRDGEVDEPNTSDPDTLRDAAFFSLVSADEGVGRAVVEELVAQANEPAADFADASRFCPDQVRDSHPHFVIAEWMTKRLYAFDYTKQWATPAEKQQIRAWHRNAAQYLLPETNAVFGRLFRNREAGDYRPVNEPDYDQVGFFGSQETSSYARHYNNRWGSIIRFVSLVGVDQNIEEFITAGKRWVKEFLIYSVYPEGWIAEFRRWLPNNESNAGHELGYTYTANLLGQMIAIADALARTGDTELYDFETNEGLYGTEGGPKSLVFAIESMARHLNGTFRRYGTATASAAGDEEYRIDSVFEGGEYYSMHDVMLAPANVYYRSPLIRQMYTRTGDGMPPYPEQAAPNGPYPVWAGESGTLPGVLFMFGETEGLVDPYPRSTRPSAELDAAGGAEVSCRNGCRPARAPASGRPAA